MPVNGDGLRSKKQVHLILNKIVITFRNLSSATTIRKRKGRCLRVQRAAGLYLTVIRVSASLVQPYGATLGQAGERDWMVRQAKQGLIHRNQITSRGPLTNSPLNMIALLARPLLKRKYMRNSFFFLFFAITIKITHD
ncbi:hypothetical protein NDU88_003641 [Pleurodeles waltl]|uniref:Uncharacterized protein n=1 Tax=Pleurodeles waltl TaxID=8319 RepID=A0AAV7QA87_PLEWA|nr:hypothetical protein NDU88_003641 [Pleurodeles waltl]